MHVTLWQPLNGPIRELVGWFQHMSQQDQDQVISCLQTMDHITQHHIEQVKDKSTFVPGLDVEQAIEDVLSKPAITAPHSTKANRTWYFRPFTSIIGYRGIDGRACRWLAVLLKGQYLVTAYPIVHPYTLKFMRQDSSHQVTQQLALQ